MGNIAGSAARNRGIVTGIAGAMVGLLFGISITAFAVNASERDAATGPGRSAGGLVEPWVFEAPLERYAATGPGRSAGGLVEPWVFEAPLERYAPTGPARSAGGLVEPWLFEAPLERD